MTSSLQHALDLKHVIEGAIRKGESVRLGDVMWMPGTIPPAATELRDHFRQFTAEYAAKIGVSSETLSTISSDLSLYVWDAANSGHGDSRVLDEIIAYWQQPDTTHGPRRGALPLPIAVGCALMLLETRAMSALRDKKR
jgi:hypothetical protein